MGLLRWALLGATGFGIFRYLTRGGPRAERRELDGVCATFPTREGADLAIEHLVQEYGIDRAFIYVEPAEDENSSGLETSGGDHASKAGHGERVDAPLHGVIELTVACRAEKVGVVKTALEDTGAMKIEVF
jgi:hypothetical protein